MKLRYLLVRLVALVLTLTVPGITSAADNVRLQEEFGFSVALPTRAICNSTSGGHHHGWGAPLDGDCERASRGITVLANYNAAFQASAEEAAYCNPDGGGSLKAGAKLGLTFAGRRSATCMTRRSDGSILVTVVAQAGHWPMRSGDPPEFRTPWINYYAYLQTRPDTLDSDLLSFRRVLRSIRIAPPRQAT